MSVCVCAQEVRLKSSTGPLCQHPPQHPNVSGGIVGTGISEGAAHPSGLMSAPGNELRIAWLSTGRDFTRAIVRAARLPLHVLAADLLFCRQECAMLDAKWNAAALLIGRILLGVIGAGCSVLTGCGHASDGQTV